MKQIGKVIGVAILFAAVEVGGAAGYEAVDVKGGGTIVGEVDFDGNPPPAKKIEVTKDQEVCGKEKEAEDLIVSADKKIANAVVSISDIEKGKKLEPTTVTLDQKGCHYVPHVLMVPAGSTVKILNSDGILHNIHTYGKKNPPVNIAQPKFKKEVSTKFDQPENVDVKCDAHAWMGGVFVVQDNPYFAMTDEKGTFKLTDVPPGEYTLKVWHEKLGEKTEKVKVEAGKEAKVVFKLAAK